MCPRAGSDPFMNSYRMAIPPALKAALKGNPFVRRQTAYKFHHAEDGKYIYKDGTIKIGRLSDFRSMEKDTLRDEYEGLEWTGFHNDRPTRLSEVDPRSSVRKVIIGNDTTTIQALSIIVPSEDLYAYCFSYECSKSVAASFHDEVPYDSVAVCSDVFAVADLVCRYHPVLRGSRYLCLPVTYRERLHMADEPYASPREQAFEKPLKFEDNLEGRIVFIPPPSSRERPALPPWRHPALLRLFRPHTMPS